MTKKEYWQKTKEAESEYKRLSEHCNKCHGNFNDDCRDCEDFEKREIAREVFELYKKELKDKYNLDYDKFNEFIETQQDSINIDSLEDKDKEIEEWKNKYLYLQADIENIKKRYNRQIEDITKYAGENIFKDILEVLDILEFSMNDDIDVLHAYNELIKLLDKYEVKPIYDEERPVYFNNEYDEAVSSVQCDDKALDNSINKVYKRGYKFKDKILRFEKVIVNKYKDYI